MLPKGVFVTGTDTGVGKTLVCAGLVRLARIRGVNAVGLKPIETGCTIRDGELHPEDGEFLWEASEKVLTLDECTPFRFAFPAAPYRAASVVGTRLFPGEIVGHITEIAGDIDLTIVEGAGGLMVPIDQRTLMIDLIADLGYPVLLVSRSRLGTINHTLLSLSTLRSRDISILGVIVSFSDRPSGPEEDFVISDLRGLAEGVPVWSLPHMEDQVKHDPAMLAELLEQALPQNSLESWFAIGSPLSET